MSYSRTYHSSVHVSGTVHVSYPASEHGGTTIASYSETVPIDWTVTVDTAPFDESVDRAENAVDALTGSVVALNAAQVESIRRSSQKVVSSLTGGFFHLIGKDLSENLVLQANIIKSKFALLLQYSKDLREKQERMDGDVARLKQHYYAIFHNLDEDTEKRIAALDRPAFSLAQTKRKEILSGPYLQGAAFGVNQLREDQEKTNMLTAARTKSKVASLLDSMGNHAQKNRDYQRELDSVLEKESSDMSIQEYFPVVVCGKDDMSSVNEKHIECISPATRESKQIESGVFEYIKTMPEARWEPLPADRLSMIDQDFRAYVEKDSTDTNSKNERVHREMLKLWEASKNTMLGI